VKFKVVTKNSLEEGKELLLNAEEYQEYAFKFNKMYVIE